MKSLFNIIIIIQWYLFNSSNKILYQYQSDIPKKIKAGVVYVIGDTLSPWLLLLKCPCGCKRNIHLNLLKEASPCWDFKVNKSLITISPSIWGLGGCKSHFVIKNGNIKWVK